MNTEDRELLELAAKAAGLELVTPTMLEHDKWNPLTDDGDAFRLMVKLRFDIVFDFSQVKADATFHSEWSCFYGPSALGELSGDDGLSTRRAIVRAAAEIGRRMP